MTGRTIEVEVTKTEIMKGRMTEVGVNETEIRRKIEIVPTRTKKEAIETREKKEANVHGMETTRKRETSRGKAVKMRVRVGSPMSKRDENVGNREISAPERNAPERRPTKRK